jgi:hypothetical protein
MLLNSFDKQLNFSVENGSIHEYVCLLVLFKCFLWIDTIFYVKMDPRLRQVYSCEDFNETQMVDMKI